MDSLARLLFLKLDNKRMGEATKNHRPPRLSALLASDAPVGIVFRRGPTNLVRAILWDRERDKFKPGQLFKGRIFVDRSDLSPDGRHMIYFAMGGANWAIPETGGTWTAISAVPSLKAITLWGQGGETWGGGGLFTSNSSYWLDLNLRTFLIRDESKLTRFSTRPAEYDVRRAGWVRKETARGGIYEKFLPNGWVLRRIDQYPKAHRYEIELLEDRTKLEFRTWEWADWDRSRLVWAEQGWLRAAKLGVHKLGRIRTLYDFNETDVSRQLH